MLTILILLSFSAIVQPNTFVASSARLLTSVHSSSFWSERDERPSNNYTYLTRSLCLWRTVMFIDLWRSCASDRTRSSTRVFRTRSSRSWSRVVWVSFNITSSLSHSSPCWEPISRFSSWICSSVSWGRCSAICSTTLWMSCSWGRSFWQSESFFWRLQTKSRSAAVAELASSSPRCNDLSRSSRTLTWLIDSL